MQTITWNSVANKIVCKAFSPLECSQNELPDTFYSLFANNQTQGPNFDAYPQPINLTRFVIEVHPHDFQPHYFWDTNNKASWPQTQSYPPTISTIYARVLQNSRTTNGSNAPTVNSTNLPVPLYPETTSFEPVTGTNIETMADLFLRTGSVYVNPMPFRPGDYLGELHWQASGWLWADNSTQSAIMSYSYPRVQGNANSGVGTIDTGLGAGTGTIPQIFKPFGKWGTTDESQVLEWNGLYEWHNDDNIIFRFNAVPIVSNQGAWSGLMFASVATVFITAEFSIGTSSE